MLTQEDKEWIKSAFETSMKSLTERHQALGKRVNRTEQAFDELARVARQSAVDAAKKNHAKLVQEMFDRSDVLALPSLVDDGGGKMTRGPVPCDSSRVETFFANYDGDYEVELAPKLGFRLVHKSRSAQRRRKDGGHILKHAKADALEKLGLHLQYDKPFGLREIQGKAQKFLAALKREGKGVVSSVGAKGGYLHANDVRLAPEYLVPSAHRWNGLVGQVLTKIRGWGSRAPNAPDTGVMFDVFGFEYAADQGVFDLSEFPLDEDEHMAT